MTSLIANNDINRLAFRIYRRHLLRWTLEGPAGSYADVKLSRLICAALRDAKGNPAWVGDEFEERYFEARDIARRRLAKSTGGEYPSVDERIADAIDALNRFFARIAGKTRTVPQERYAEVNLGDARFESDQLAEVEIA